MLWFSQVGKRSMDPGAVNTEDVWDCCRAVTRKTSLEYIKLIPCFLYSASIREMITGLKTESEDCS